MLSAAWTLCSHGSSPNAPTSKCSFMTSSFCFRLYERTCVAFNHLYLLCHKRTNPFLLHVFRCISDSSLNMQVMWWVLQKQPDILCFTPEAKCKPSSSLKESHRKWERCNISPLSTSLSSTLVFLKRTSCLFCCGTHYVFQDEKDDEEDEEGEMMSDPMRYSEVSCSSFACARYVLSY